MGLGVVARVRRLDDYIRQLGNAARSGRADIETIVRLVVEEALASVSSRCGGAGVDGGLAERLERLEERLERIERLLERLAEQRQAHGRPLDERRLAEELARSLAASVAAAVKQALPHHHSGAGGGGDPPWLRAVLERLRERGYLLSHELPPDVAGQLDPELLRRRGLVVIPAAGGLLVARREALEELRRSLERLRGVGDEYEAQARLGRLRGLFRALREEGLLYYRGPSTGWILKVPGV